jgi:hypothetical protein
MSFSSTGPTYVLNQKLMSLSGDLWIDDSSAHRTGAVRRRPLTIRARIPRWRAAGA